MSDTEKTGAGATESGIPPADLSFIMECLKHASGSISIDTNAVAEVLKYKNIKSVSNRLAAMKKKYDIPFGSGGAKAAGADAPTRKAGGAAGPKPPATPSKNRVTKPAAKKKAATAKSAKGKGKKAKAEEEVNQEESDHDNGDDAEEVNEVEHKEDEATFDKKDTDEEDNDEEA